MLPVGVKGSLTILPGVVPTCMLCGVKPGDQVNVRRDSAFLGQRQKIQKSTNYNR